MVDEGGPISFVNIMVLTLDDEDGSGWTSGHVAVEYDQGGSVRTVASLLRQVAEDLDPSPIERPDDPRIGR